MKTWYFVIALVIAAAAPPADRPRPPDGPRQAVVSPLRPTVDGIWTDAAIGTDPDYQKLITHAGISAAAPRDVRRIAGNWPPPRNLRGWPQQLSVGFQDGHVTVSGKAELGCGDQVEAARQRFVRALNERGYRPLDQDELKAFQNHVELNLTEHRAAFKRTSGETELLVSFEAAPYTGSSTYRSGVRWSWIARRHYRGPQPTLAEALAVLPGWMKVKYLDEKLFALLADEPIASLSSGPDFSITFVRPVTDALVGALEQTGFEYRNEASPARDGSTQKTWYRFSDITFAQVIVSGDRKVVRLYCQPPQHTGDPIKVKPPPLHPSLRLPPEKRPILTFEQLNFADGEIRRKAKLFHDLAERLSRSDWDVQRYKDVRYSVQPFFTAHWQSSPLTSSSYIASARPCQVVTISLQGRLVDGSDTLNSLSVSGAAVPQEGWAARVIFSVHLSPDGTARSDLAATAGFARGQNIFSFDIGTGSKLLPLTQQVVSATVNETSIFRYQFQSQSTAATLERSLRMLYGTPETLRDEVLADIDLLRKQSHEQLKEGTSIVVYDMTNVRSDNPPRQEPAARRPPSARTKQALMDEVEKQLGAQEASIRQSFREIHAAIQQALPIDPSRDRLSAP